MSNFKFRAWDDLNKQWLMGYELTNLGGFSLTGECMLFGEWAHCFDEFIFEKNGKKNEHLIIEQWSGFKDSNGKDIFAGDILDVHSGNSQYTIEVSFENGCFMGETAFTKRPLNDYLTATDFESAEVYQNIHENPQLI